MNWFLYIVTESFIDDEGREVHEGESGVGQCSMSAGIMDAYRGIMYVAPGAYITSKLIERETKKHPSAYVIKKIIEDYYNEKEVIEIKSDDDDFFI